MSQVITFSNYVPSPRYDDTPWTEARIEEGEAADGPWVELETITLDPVDDDPENPQSRNFTTELASDTAGLWYRIVFVDETGDELAPTDPVQNAVADDLYLTRADLKDALDLDGTSFEDEEIDECIEAACRAIDAWAGQPFYPTVDTRHYTADARDPFLRIHPVSTVTSVTLDFDGDGTYETTWEDGVDFVLDPENADVDGRPFNQITLLEQAGRRFPRYRRAVKITGSWGWAETPIQVRKAAKILAHRLLRRNETPYAFQIAAAGDAVALARIGKIDPDVAFLVGQIPGVKRSSSSLQLH